MEINYKNIARSIQVEVDSQLREMTQHGSLAAPIAVYVDEYSQYHSHIVQRHWHEEIQFSYALDGEVLYEIDGEQARLVKRQGIFINSNVIHMSKLSSACDARLISILFSPAYINGADEPNISAKYIAPFTAGNRLHWLHFTGDQEWHETVLKLIERIIERESKHDFASELAIRNCVSEIWLQIIENNMQITHLDTNVQPLDRQRVQIMLRFIHENYSEPIALMDIANSANISISECCRCFKRVLFTTPFNYLLLRRIKVASGKLLSTSLSVSEVAECTGFSSTNYFIRQFKKTTGSTPLAFRKTNSSGLGV